MMVAGVNLHDLNAGLKIEILALKPAPIPLKGTGPGCTGIRCLSSSAGHDTKPRRSLFMTGDKMMCDPIGARSLISLLFAGLLPQSFLPIL